MTLLHCFSRLSAANSSLAPYAVRHCDGLGREYAEKEDETRFPFQRDRDRIIHTQAFRRLKGKTQVFIASKGDHYRTRLTHTMEVAQISRDMARTLGLNEDLAECIALAHDLGHTPFAHAGENAMREEMEKHGGTFEHNLQSFRIVTLLEERTSHYKGLNLCKEILDGLMKHRTAFDRHAHKTQRAPSLEASVVNLADEIAYTAHDIDDGMRAEMLKLPKLRSLALFAEAETKANEGGTEVRGSIIHLLVMDAYGETERRIAAHGIQTLDDVYAAKTDVVAFSLTMQEKLAELREFLASNFYFASPVRKASEEGAAIIHTLFKRFMESPPEKVLILAKKTGSQMHEAIKDYIAGMTDEFAMEMAANTQEDPPLRRQRASRSEDADRL